MTKNYKIKINNLKKKYFKARQILKNSKNKNLSNALIYKIKKNNHKNFNFFKDFSMQNKK